MIHSRDVRSSKRFTIINHLPWFMTGEVNLEHPGKLLDGQNTRAIC